MAKPLVSVVGRPNVGKSTLVNRLAQRGFAIVDATPGVTRDRSYHEADWNGREFILVDTGGIEPVRTGDAFQAAIRQQALAALAESSVIVMVVDAQSGVTAEDEAVARLLRKARVPVVLVANKVESPQQQNDLWDFLSLGFGEPFAVSALHGTGTGDLLDAVVERFSPLSQANEDDLYTPGTINVAVVGRPNVGKSSLVNRLAGSERSIVSEIAGTTRDAVDIVVEHAGALFRLVDTAGMRKRPQVVEDVEYYSTVRGLMAMEEADVCWLVIDASEGAGEQDQKILTAALRRGCALVIVLNKWDLVRDEEDRELVQESLLRRLEFCRWAPQVAVSAKTGHGVQKIWKVTKSSVEHRQAQLATSKINDLLATIRQSGHSVSAGKLRLKIYYGVQTATAPPTITFFCNHPELASSAYKRYLERRLRETFDLEGTPLTLRFRKR